MSDTSSQRQQRQQELAVLERDMQELKASFERFFAGNERCPPLKLRQDLERRLRQFSQRPITNTSLKFRYQTLAQRFQTYARQWDRQLTMLEEGRLDRGHTGAPVRPRQGASRRQQTDSIYEQYQRLRQEGASSLPQRSEKDLNAWVTQQRQKLVARYGEQAQHWRLQLKQEQGRLLLKAQIPKNKNPAASERGNTQS